MSDAALCIRKEIGFGSKSASLTVFRKRTNISNSPLTSLSGCLSCTTTPLARRFFVSSGSARACLHSAVNKSMLLVPRYSLKELTSLDGH